jgi:hypothetical protein
MKSFFLAIAQWLRERLSGRLCIATVLGPPEALKARTFYLIGEGGSYWSAVFQCPCGCGDDVWLNLIEAPGRPTWKVRQHGWSSFSVAPSVWRKVGCHSHFWIRKGRVHRC